jgi:hypothetical protein
MPVTIIDGGDGGELDEVRELGSDDRLLRGLLLRLAVGRLGEELDELELDELEPEQEEEGEEEAG